MLFNTFKRVGSIILFYLPFYLFSQDVPKPSWVNNPPESNEDRYIGTASESIDRKNYIELAERRALRSIAMEINTDISSVSRRQVTEINDISKSEFTNEYIVSTLANFKGLIKKEYIDQTKNIYYVLIRILYFPIYDEGYLFSTINTILCANSDAHNRESRRDE